MGLRMERTGRQTVLDTGEGPLVAVVHGFNTGQLCLLYFIPSFPCSVHKQAAGDQCQPALAASVKVTHEGA